MSAQELINKNTKTKPKKETRFGEASRTPGVLIAATPKGAVSTYRFPITDKILVGRDVNADVPISDSMISRRHLQISVSDGDYVLEDLGSSNGTFLSGNPVTQRLRLLSSEVIRAGDTILVFHSDIEPLGGKQTDPIGGFVGKFHSRHIFQKLKTALLTEQPLLLTGPSGSGKGLLVEGLAAFLSESKGPSPFVSYNMARFTSEAEIVSTLFGVVAGVFSGVGARPGLIEQANRGVLFLDEIHNLPIRVQRSLLKIVEDGEFSRIGDKRNRKIDVRFVMASNSADPDCGLAHDLLARFHQVRIPSLKERVADIPGIFDYILAGALRKFKLKPSILDGLFNGDHYEALCLDGFTKDNVRGIDNFVSNLVARIAAGEMPDKAVTNAFSERFGQGKVAARTSDAADETEDESAGSHFENNKELIIDMYNESGGNITKTQKMLNKQGVSCSRRWLSVFLDQWGVRKTRNRKK